MDQTALLCEEGYRERMTLFAISEVRCCFFRRPTPQYRPEEDVETNVIYRLKLDQLSLNRPSVEEKEGISKHLWPYEARTRNLTYSSPLYVDVEQTTYTVDPETNIEVGLFFLLLSVIFWSFSLCVFSPLTFVNDVKTQIS